MMETLFTRYISSFIVASSLHCLAVATPLQYECDWTDTLGKKKIKIKKLNVLNEEIN